MTWQRISRVAIVVAVLGVLAFAAGADWFGGAAVVSDSGSTVTHGHHAH